MFPSSLSSRLHEAGIALPSPPTPLGSYVECAEVGSLLFLSGVLPVVDRKLSLTGRLGENLTVQQGQQAARIAALNSLAAAQQHLGDLDRLKRLVKLTLQLATTEEFSEHATVAEGASEIFVKIFGPTPGHTRVVFGVQSLPIRAPLVVETTFEIIS